MDSHNYFNFIPNHRMSHFTSNCTCFWGGLPFSQDQTFMWNLSHYYEGNIVSTHKTHFMLSISLCLCNTFLSTLIQNSNQGWMWNNNPWHQLHLGPSPRLCCFSIGCGKCFQFGVKGGHISRTSCNRWGHHIIHPFCLCIRCIWMSLVL
jgi:hypothetical protein